MGKGRFLAIGVNTTNISKTKIFSGYKDRQR